MIIIILKLFCYFQIFLFFMNGFLVILSYLSYKRARKYPLALVTKIGGTSDNCGLGGEEVHAKTTNSGYSILFHSILRILFCRPCGRRKVSRPVTKGCFENWALLFELTSLWTSLLPQQCTESIKNPCNYKKTTWEYLVHYKLLLP